MYIIELLEEEGSPLYHLEHFIDLHVTLATYNTHFGTGL